MKRILTSADVEAAVLGGAILGGGGGGLIEAGRRIARQAVDAGLPELWTPDEFDDEDITMTVAIIGAPAAPDAFVRPSHLLRSIELMRQTTAGKQFRAFNANENGAETTVNGWYHAAITGVPVLDLACNGRAHPSSVMGALALHRQIGFRSTQTFCGGRDARYVEGSVTGSLHDASRLVREASVDAGGFVAVARNPVSVGYARAHGAPEAISAAIELGQVFLDRGLTAAISHLGGRIVASGRVTKYDCKQVNGLDVGAVWLEGDGKIELKFVNEYMTLRHDGERVSAFPNLIMTFDGNDQPVESARVRAGMDLKVVVAPAERLLLSTTMWMPELYTPFERAIDESFAPVA
ncbi:DUF917 family protein [Burkholderia multivorans]|uniref:DUF917 family protein n=1 Tax=Burkholderia multivorans TaxID=87883 RepID=A0AB37APY0_9BURK|nr:DUF917 family protein [Burkholderia multivorans]MBU9589646.1 DUF917 family protein [Burkholderia multivorans]PRE39281.1 hypothetical protein C6P97_30790 [Burkholderia multivorans]PRE42297.1 hypothetical protein C6P99_24815 [Burkholderia multivorans]